MNLTFILIVAVGLPAEDVDTGAEAAGSGVSSRFRHLWHLLPEVSTYVISLCRFQQVHLLGLYSTASVDKLFLHIT